MIKLDIKNLGPVKEAHIGLGDITVLMGPPNSGKSYTLRALYASLLPLDQLAINHEVLTILNSPEFWEFEHRLSIAVPRFLEETLRICSKSKRIEPKTIERLVDNLKKEMHVDHVNFTIENTSMEHGRQQAGRTSAKGLSR